MHALAQPVPPCKNRWPWRFLTHFADHLALSHTLRGTLQTISHAGLMQGKESARKSVTSSDRTG